MGNLSCSCAVTVDPAAPLHAGHLQVHLCALDRLQDYPVLNLPRRALRGVEGGQQALDGGGQEREKGRDEAR